MEIVRLLFQGFSSTKRQESAKNSFMEAVAETRTILRKRFIAKSDVVLLEDLVVDIELQRISLVYNDLITYRCKKRIRMRYFKIITF